MPQLYKPSLDDFLSSIPVGDYDITADAYDVHVRISTQDTPVGTFRMKLLLKWLGIEFLDTTKNLTFYHILIDGERYLRFYDHHNAYVNGAGPEGDYFDQETSTPVVYVDAHHDLVMEFVRGHMKSDSVWR